MFLKIETESVLELSKVIFFEKTIFDNFPRLIYFTKFFTEDL